MKILAIRGLNLASLQGKFELDFTQEPLFGCGLFAITGETGAGKSTILDAMCLALYGRYPRITAQGEKNKIENTMGEALATSDPRSILRTGCSQAFAQVDLMVDDKHLQASWRVRRAFGKTSGNLLDFERALIDLRDNSVLASGKKRVDEEIARRLKLTYEQFGRTVLLAQNDFDAFLRAGDGDRADLLEKITGTELYSNISAKAFEAERRALADLQELQKATGFIEVLSKEDRSRLQELVKASRSTHQEWAKKGQKIRQDLDWYGRHEEAVKRLGEAKNQAKHAKQQWADAGEDRALLANLERARSAQGLIEKAERHEQSLDALHKQTSSQQAEIKQLQHWLAKADERERQQAQKSEASEQALKNAAPLFVRAMHLDTQISALKTRQDEGQAALLEAKKTRAELLEQQAKQLEKTKQMGERLEVLQRAQLAEAALEEVSRRAKDMASLFRSLGDLQVKQEDLRAQQAAQQQQSEASAEKLAEMMDDGQTLKDSLARLRAKCDDSAKNLANNKPDQMRLKRDHQSDCQAQFNRLYHHVEQLVEQTTLIEKTGKTLREAQHKSTRSSEQVQELETALSDLKSRAAEAERALIRSKSALSKQVLSLRAKLQPDEPCVVCGSTDHPGQDDKANNELLELMRARSRELAEEIDRNEQARNRAQQALQHAKARIESADDRLAIATDKLAQLQQKTGSLSREVQAAARRLDLSLRVVGSPQKLLVHIAELRQTNEHQMVDVRKQLLTIQQLEAQNRSCAEQVLALESARQKQLKDHDELVKTDRKSRQEAHQLAERADRLSTHSHLVSDQLLSLLSDLEISKRDLKGDLKALLKRLQKQTSRYDQQQKEAEQIKSSLNKAQGEGAVLEERIEHIGARCVELAGQLDEIVKKLQRQQNERRELFAGRGVAKIRSDMEGAIKRDNRALQEVIVGKRESAARLEEVEKNLARGRELTKTTSRSQQQAQKARDAALRRKKLQLPQALSLLAIRDEQAGILSKRIEHLVEHRTKSAALLSDRKQHLSEIENTNKPPRARVDLEDDLREIEADQAMLMIDLGKNESALELNDTARKNRQKLSRKIEGVEKKYALWAVMSGAIGSKTGDKFRRFAQGVTLDHLIALANQQLRHINPRYKIERNTIGGLGLQVMDIEMGGEIRSVRSLSGGERFLVSLALALGLSQLDGRSSFVDTLMIDEGFGALDARSLDIVVEALESLQSQGRKVGVISHIEALTERIPVQVRVEKQGSGRSRVRVIEQGVGG